MSEENNKKTNFLKETFKSIKDLDKYEDFALEKPSKAFKYLLKLILVFAIVISIFYTYKIVENMNDIYSNLKSKIPDFSYTEGTLIMGSKEPIIIDDYTDMLGKIIIDTNISDSEIDKYKKEIKEDSVGILVLKDECVILSNIAIGEY